MKILKTIGIVLLVLILLLLVLSIVMSKDIKVERSTVIDAPKSMVFNAINDLKAQEAWSPWKKADKTMEWTYGDVVVGKGAKYDWTSEESGSGTYEIVESVPGESIATRVSFDQGGGDGLMSLESEGKKTKVTWSFETTMGWPNNLFSPFAKMSMNSSFKKGFKSLNSFVLDRMETKVYNGYKINEVVMPERHFVYNRQEVDMANMQQFYATNLGALFGKVQNAGAESDGMPCGFYYKWDTVNNMADMAAAIPVKKAITVKDASSVTLPEREALQIDFYGDYSNLGDAHNAIAAYMSDYGILNDVPIVEEYVTDPGAEKDPKKWLTKITYYVAK